jgi:hypothetical protein
MASKREYSLRQYLMAFGARTAPAVERTLSSSDLTRMRPWFVQRHGAPRYTAQRALAREGLANPVPARFSVKKVLTMPPVSRITAKLTVKL